MSITRARLWLLFFFVLAERDTRVAQSYTRSTVALLEPPLFRSLVLTTEERDGARVAYANFGAAATLLTPLRGRNLYAHAVMPVSFSLALAVDSFVKLLGDDLGLSRGAYPPFAMRLFKVFFRALSPSRARERR